MKVAQLAALLDGLPEEVALKCRQLLDQGPALSTAEVGRLALREIGKMGDKLVDLEPEPLGSGSIAVVHRATLGQMGDVVLKIRRPNAPRRISSDLKILRRMPLGEFQSAVEYLEPILRREVDLSIEGETTTMAHAFVEKLEGSSVVVPRVLNCTPAMLVMAPALGVAPGGGVALPPPDIMTEVYTIHFLLGALAGRFHADPHPGNFLWDGSSSRLTWLDWGQWAVSRPKARQFWSTALLDIMGEAPAERRLDLKLTNVPVGGDDRSVYTDNKPLIEDGVLLAKSLFQLHRLACGGSPTEPSGAPSCRAQAFTRRFVLQHLDELRSAVGDTNY